MQLNNKKNLKLETSNKPVLVRRFIGMMTLMSCLTSQHLLAACAVSPDSRYEFIDTITVNGAQLVAGADITAGDVIRLSPSFASYRYQEYWSVWVDLNGDGDFADANERLLQTSSPTDDEVEATLIFADDISLDNTQLRVLLHANAVSGDSCNNWMDYCNYT